MVAVGQGWIRKHLFLRWRVYDIGKTNFVLVTPPNTVVHFMWRFFSHMLMKPAPGLMLIGLDGERLWVKVDDLGPEQRREIADQLPRTARITPAAQLFLATGEIRGPWSGTWGFVPSWPDSQRPRQG